MSSVTHSSSDMSSVTHSSSDKDEEDNASNASFIDYEHLLQEVADPVKPSEDRGFGEGATSACVGAILNYRAANLRLLAENFPVPPRIEVPPVEQNQEVPPPVEVLPPPVEVLPPPVEVLPPPVEVLPPPFAVSGFRRRGPPRISMPFPISYSQLVARRLQFREIEVPGIGFRNGIELPWNYWSIGIELHRHCQWNELEHRCLICWRACFKPTATSCCGSVCCERCIRRKVHMTKTCPACYKKLLMKKLVRLYVDDMRCDACREWMPFADPVATTTCGHVFCRHCLQDNCPICGRRLHERDILDLDLEDVSTAYIHFL